MTTIRIRCAKISEDPDLKGCIKVICCACGEPLWMSQEIFDTYEDDMVDGVAFPVCSEHSITGMLRKKGIL